MNTTGFGTLDVPAFGQFPNLRRRNLPRLVEIKLLQRFQPRELGITNPFLNRMPVSLLRFHGQQRFQIADVAALFLDRLLGQPHEICSDDRHAHRLAILLHTGVFECLCLGLLFHDATSTTVWVTPKSWSYSSIFGSGLS